MTFLYLLALLTISLSVTIPLLLNFCKPIILMLLIKFGTRFDQVLCPSLKVFSYKNITFIEELVQLKNTFINNEKNRLFPY